MNTTPLTYYTPPNSNGPGIAIYITAAGWFKAEFELRGDKIERQAESLAALKSSLDSACKAERPKLDVRGTIVDARTGRSATAILRGINGSTGDCRVEVNGRLLKFGRTGMGEPTWNAADLVFVPEHVDLDLSTEIVARAVAVQKLREQQAKATAHFDELASVFGVQLRSFRSYGRSTIPELATREAKMVAQIAKLPANPSTQELALAAE